MDNFERIKLMDREEMSEFLAYVEKEVIDYIEQSGRIKTDFSLENQINANLDWLSKEL